MTKAKDNVPAAPEQPVTHPASESGAGTSEAQAPEQQDAEPVAQQAPEQIAPSRPVPGSPEFDPEAAGVSSAELAEHLAILQNRAAIKALTNPELIAEAAPVEASGFGGYTPAPDDIKAVKSGETRYFSALTWEAMATQGKHDGWEEYVEKPADVKKK